MTNSLKVERTRRGQSGSAADVAVIADLVFEKGKTYRDAAAYLGWTYSRVSEAARAYKGMESDNRGGRDARGRERSEHNVAVSQMTSRTTIVPDEAKSAIAEHVAQASKNLERAAERFAKRVAKTVAVVSGNHRKRMAARAAVREVEPDRAVTEVDVAAEAPKRRRRRLPTPDEVRARAADDLLTVDWSNWLSDGAWERSAPAPAEIWGEDEDGEAVLSHLAVDPGVLWPVGWEGPRSWSEIRLEAPAARPAKRRALITSAQNRTPIHGPAWVNMQALALHYNATIAIGGFTYGKGLFEAGGKDAVQIAPYSSEIAEGVFRTRLGAEVAIVEFAAEMNLSPTLSRPLTGLAGYARGRSTIFSHPKRAMESVPRPKGAAPVHLRTTGAITVPNYVLMKAGLKAVATHCIGCLLVEEDFDGRVFVRDVAFDPEFGDAYDLDIHVADGVVRSADEYRKARDIPGPIVAWGDVHEDHLNSDCAKAAWGVGGHPEGDVPLVDAIMPSSQVIHDLLNFTAQSHHGRDDPWKAIAKLRDGTNLVEPEVAAAAKLLTRIDRTTTETVVIYSNHDEHLCRWLRETDWRADPAKASIYLSANLAFVEAARAGRELNMFEWAIRRAEPSARFRLVTVDQTEMVYGVHYSFHGDKGPNGSRGSTAGLARLGQPITKAHDHTLSILDDVRSGGCLIDYPDYATGPSTWAHGCVIGHPDGSRQSIEFVGGKWRA